MGIFLRYRIRDFAIKYGRQLNLDGTKVAKSLKDKLSRAKEGGDSLALDLARRDLEREVKKSFQRSREMQRVSAWGGSTKVPLSANKIGQVPRRVRARPESWDARRLSSALP